jgi:two-component system response regulator YesN
MDAIRELRSRGSRVSVILITAYERFDIAREAVELGVLDYLLKPVSKDALARSLRAALAFLERKAEAQRREIEVRERTESMRALAETAFLQSLMLGERSEAEMERYRSALGIPETFGLAIAVAIVPPPGAIDSEAEASTLYEALKLSLRYKTRAMAALMTKGLCALFLPLRDEREAAQAIGGLRAVIEANHGADLARGRLRLGCGKARPFAQAFDSWSEALSDLLGAEERRMADGLAEESFDDDAAFLEALASASPERASLSLERILSSLRGRDLPSASERHRVAILLGEAARELRRRGALSGPAVAEAMDLSDLLSTTNATELELASRSRFTSLAAASLTGPKRTTALDVAIQQIKEDFGRPLTLDLIAGELGISAARLSRFFVEGTGKGFSDFLIEYRIERAKEMLLEPEASIKQVSVACGYSDPNYFSRLFKKVTGVTPSSFSSGKLEVSNENR